MSKTLTSVLIGIAESSSLLQADSNTTASNAKVDDKMIFFMFAFFLGLTYS